MKEFDLDRIAAVVSTPLHGEIPWFGTTKLLWVALDEDPHLLNLGEVRQHIVSAFMPSTDEVKPRDFLEVVVLIK